MKIFLYSSGAKEKIKSFTFTDTNKKPLSKVVKSPTKMKKKTY